MPRAVHDRGVVSSVGSRTPRDSDEDSLDRSERLSLRKNGSNAGLLPSCSESDVQLDDDGGVGVLL